MSRDLAGWEVAHAQLLAEEMKKHEYLSGPWFNLRCKCGYVESTVSTKDSFPTHLSRALVEAGWNNNVCPFDCDGCHSEDCPCDRLGCAGSVAPGAK